MSDTTHLFNHDLPETFWAWLAGFIDGDGSIGFAQSPNGGQPRCDVQIGQKGREILDSIVRDLGVGSVIFNRQLPDSDSIYYCLRLGSKAGRLVCERILPYLRDPGKKERATKAVAWKRLMPGEWSTSPEKHDLFLEAIKLYREGMSSAVIAERLGLKPKRVASWVARAGAVRKKCDVYRLRGLAMRGKQKTTKNSVKRAEALTRHAQGENGFSISKALGVSPTIVYYWIRVARESQDP